MHKYFTKKQKEAYIYPRTLSFALRAKLRASGLSSLSAPEQKQYFAARKHFYRVELARTLITAAVLFLSFYWLAVLILKVFHR